MSATEYQLLGPAGNLDLLETEINALSAVGWYLKELHVNPSANLLAGRSYGDQVAYIAVMSRTVDTGPSTSALGSELRRQWRQGHDCICLALEDDIDSCRRMENCSVPKPQELLDWEASRI